VNQSGNQTGDTQVSSLQAQIDKLPKESLSSVELASLSFMREEEKMARDVYSTLYGQWGASIFQNIAKSEQSHMDAILLLLKKYNIQDSVSVNGVGIFNDATIRQLYVDLVSKGSSSKLSAYIVGVTIEDLDLFDLQKAVLKVDNQDIKLVYDLLAKGSRNHLRSFYKNVLNAGGAYTPQYITQPEFEAIVNSPMESGNF
jgi:hypothetical protein